MTGHLCLNHFLRFVLVLTAASPKLQGARSSETRVVS